MKKFLSLLTLMSLLASFTACGENTETSVSESIAVTTETETQTEEETTTETIITEPETTATETVTETEMETTETETETTETEVTTEQETTTTETEIITETTVTEIAESVTEPAPADTSVIPEATQPVQPTLIHFVLNMETNCIHEDPQCTAAQKILQENYTEIDIYDNELQNYNNIYWACGKCCSDNTRNILPKF